MQTATQALRPGETHHLHNSWFIVQSAGFYEVAWKEGGKFYDRHGRTEGFYTPPVKVAAPAPVVAEMHTDEGYDAHKVAMLNDLNYSRWWESGGLIGREES